MDPGLRFQPGLSVKVLRLCHELRNANLVGGEADYGSVYWPLGGVFRPVFRRSPADAKKGVATF